MGKAALTGESSGVTPLLGKRVQVHGTSRDDMNGQAGTASAFDAEKGRYVVDLDNIKGTFRFKPDNLKLDDASANCGATEGSLAKEVAALADPKAAELAKRVEALEQKLADAEQANGSPAKKARTS